MAFSTAAVLPIAQGRMTMRTCLPATMSYTSCIGTSLTTTISLFRLMWLGKGNC